MANEELAWKYASSLGSTLSFRMVDDKHVLFIGWQASLAPFFFFVPVFFCYLLCWPSVGFLLRLFLRRPREEYDRQLRMLLLLLSPKEEKEAQKKKRTSKARGASGWRRSVDFYLCEASRRVVASSPAASLPCFIIGLGLGRRLAFIIHSWLARRRRPTCATCPLGLPGVGPSAAAAVRRRHGRR